MVKGELNSYAKVKYELSTNNGLLLRGSRQVIPVSLRSEILSSISGAQCGGRVSGEMSLLLLRNVRSAVNTEYNMQNPSCYHYFLVLPGKKSVRIFSSERSVLLPIHRNWYP